MSRDSLRGAQVVIHFDGQRCIHSRHCVLDRPDVFVPNVDGEWIHPDQATPAEVLELAHNCPSGAISCEAADGSAMEFAPRVNTLRLRENGPLALHAAITLNGKDEGYRLTLCRCGASENKPFCDGSHTAAGFMASGEADTSPSEPLAQRDGPLLVEPTKNGPLHLSGNLEIVSGTGHTIDRVTDCWLCRCGHSNNKPFCDGSHLTAGFRSEP
ncbi:Uncharacterized Fe-S cluster protein YjdI [Polaromonas sp. OV174]|uniref:CDGSH iron-sulfur domain-containing protein n=1 Tax=Polaromonas sp. OV174 TaxID=1855300 RepID=UPI0008F0B51C|nr:CDGSH iron-sulfur domain-containing protein [Polaromonas sp. OV174]SFC28313.1 Uncharacterized Fe-S cluster protein YjdI [Polaromonas sp. OV174]